MTKFRELVKQSVYSTVTYDEKMQDRVRDAVLVQIDAITPAPIPQPENDND